MYIIRDFHCLLLIRHFFKQLTRKLVFIRDRRQSKLPGISVAAHPNAFFAPVGDPAAASAEPRGETRAVKIRNYNIYN